MAETAVVAFGRYLRTLRQRRGLSLDDVHGLSRAFPDQIGKHYLSRAENGHLRIAFSKLIALSRIYDVPADVFVERMELDLELERIGGPETSDLSYANLTARGKQASAQGNYWRAYGYLRDAVPLARTAELHSVYRDATEQELVASMNLTIPIARTGRDKLALFELEHIQSLNGLGETLQIPLSELLAQRYNDLGDYQRAGLMTDRAVALAESVGSTRNRAFAYMDKGCLLREQGNVVEALAMFKKAFAHCRDLDLPHQSGRVLTNLARTYVDLGRLTAATRALSAAERLASRHDLHSLQINVRILSGRIAERAGDNARAAALWREAIDRARRLNDQILLFNAEFYLFRNALMTGDEVTAKAMRRLLRRRSLGIPKNVNNLTEFERLAQMNEAT